MKEGYFSFGYVGKYFLVVTIVTFFLCSSQIFAVEQINTSNTMKHRVFTLTHISAQQGKEFLTELRLGTVSQLPKTNALLVTAPQQELAKAAVLLQVVDAEQRYTVKAICPASEVRNLPSNEQIAAALGSISIGDFSKPPKETAKTKAIIDMHADSVLAIAPVHQVEKILHAIEQLHKLKSKEVLQTAELIEQRSAAEIAEQQELRTIEPEEPNIVTEIPKLPSVTSGDTAQARIEESIQELKAEPPQPETEQVAAVAEKAQEPVETTSRSYEPESVANGEESLRLNLPEKLSIVDLLGLIGEYLNLDYMYDPTKVKGDITLKLHGKLRGDLRVKDLYPLLESVLKFKGFATTRKGNLVTIVPVDEALDIDPTLIKPGVGKVERGDVIVTRVFELQYIDTGSATALLEAMKLSVAVSPIAETKTLIVTGYAYRMPRIEQLLKMVDKPGEPRKFRFRQLKYTMAKTLAEKVKTLAEQLGTVSVSISITTTEPSITRRPGESEAAFRRRQARERAIRARQPQAAAEPAQPSIYLDADERTNRILMIGIEEQLGIVDQLIDALDVEQQDLRSLQLYKIEHVEAKEVREKLQELGIIGGRATTTTQRITTGAQPGQQRGAPRPTTTTTTETEPLVEEPQVVVIESTNSLLVNATPEQHSQIATIIKYVDSQILQEEIPYKLYPLENQSPDHLAEVLERLISETVQDKEAKVEQPIITRKEEKIKIVPDPNTFSLIVYASKKNQEWIANLIKQLDKRRPQVLIDVALVEITRTELFEYDLNIIANAKDFVTNNVGVAGKTLPIDVFGSHLEGGWNLKDSDGKNTGQMQGFYAEDKIQALLTAMDRKDYGRILAQPKILVNDNEQGIISTTERTYVSEETTIVPQEGNAQVAKTWTEYPAKIELSITPNISEGDLLRLTIEMVREDFEKKEERPPDYRTSELQTVVTVPNGNTIILGGLTKLNQTKGRGKVPLLGDLPLVGGLFRSISNEDRANKLYIFVKANILRPEETVGLAQLQNISNENKTIFEKAEQEFQEKQDWPWIKPKPMDPQKVLGGI